MYGMVEYVMGLGLCYDDRKASRRSLMDPPSEDLKETGGIRGWWRVITEIQLCRLLQIHP